MAFNFNWSPLIADTSRARDMLTAALNKSPKPPIIVDDIIVTELNLGQVPPELEILEIGDLAEDRFRGIFKMSYSGDAFLTLKTRVQANPMNTYLTGKPSFASPAPLAAASGLTIPLQLTLSDIRLSGFVILVFSRQKGLTLVFRNDPLESLKVSSTFDSIPFVRDYLQKEIEKQLRILFVDDLPAILHRLSLRMFSPEYREMDDKIAEGAVEQDGTSELKADDAVPIDPLASPAADPVDSYGNPLDSHRLASLSMDPDSDATETHASFSQKNLLRLATLTSSHRTLSLFTPSMRDAVFRAWASPTTGSISPSDPHRRHSHAPSLTLAALTRMQSYTSPYPSGPSSIATGTSGGQSQDSNGTRPSLYSYPSVGQSNYTRSHARKSKRRVVNLRKKKGGSDKGESSTIPEESATTEIAETLSVPDSNIYVSSDPGPAVLAEGQMHFGEEMKSRPVSKGKESEIPDTTHTDTIRAPRSLEKKAPRPSVIHFPSQTSPTAYRPEKSAAAPITPRTPFQGFSGPFTPVSSYGNLASLSSRSQSPPHPQLTGSILEQAWIAKMAAEMAAKVREEKQGPGASTQGFWDRVADGSRFGSAGVDEAPPAYVE